MILSQSLVRTNPENEIRKIPTASLELWNNTHRKALTKVHGSGCLSERSKLMPNYFMNFINEWRKRREFAKEAELFPKQTQNTQRTRRHIKAFETSRTCTWSHKAGSSKYHKKIGKIEVGLFIIKSNSIGIESEFIFFEGHGQIFRNFKKVVWTGNLWMGWAVHVYAACGHSAWYAQRNVKAR